MNDGPGRRYFLEKTGLAAVGFTGLGLLARMDATAGTLLRGDDRWGSDPDDKNSDTAQQIFTAALIAEDLATTMYYNSLVGGVIDDPNLAGPGGSLSNPASLANVGYLQGALSAEIAHASLLHGDSGIGKSVRADHRRSSVARQREEARPLARPARMRRRFREIAGCAVEALACPFTSAQGKKPALHGDGIFGVADHVPAGAIAVARKDRVTAGDVFFRADGVDFVFNFVAF
jgi:hypothetical protein